MGHRVPLTCPADLVHHNLLHETPDRHDWNVWAGQFAPNLLDLNSGDAFPSADMAYRAAAMSQGVAIGDLSVLHEEITTGELVLSLRSANGFRRKPRGPEGRACASLHPA
ncbi:LysR substrate-binding domain-containing protein [Mesorhizobium abyssinicae]|uniref:LysR substrate-binding domain-containing protein n=1 Tax=Mesorhizobium abyssinicae TaxID=1209958 RepID=UPI00387DD4BA